jgi:DNA-binding transcriptional ArsR family regulator
LFFCAIKYLKKDIDNDVFYFIFNRMVKYYTHSLDSIFMALADATRRSILLRLMQGEASVSALAEPFNISLPAVSKHLKILDNAGLILRRKEGRIQKCELRGEAFREAAEWVENYRIFWEGQLEALEKYLDSQPAKPAEANNENE